LILSRSTRQFAVPLDGDGGNIRILVSALHVHQRCQVEMFTLKERGCRLKWKPGLKRNQEAKRAQNRSRAKQRGEANQGRSHRETEERVTTRTVTG
jgi:hypothetical protein